MKISAVCENKAFDVYLMPSKNMPTDKANSAPHITGITIKNDKLFVQNVEVLTVSAARDGLMSFLYFLKSFNKPCILLAHNVFS